MRLGAMGALVAAMLPVPLAAQPTPAPASYRERLPQDEVIYFLLPDRFENGDPANDRGGLTGDRLKTGYDPTAKGFYHGGDLKGLIKRLGYIQDLGATAIWVGPIFKNKPVQGPPGHESAGYHGYWITDFTQVDPHLGSNADFKALVDAAHARGMKVYMDIIANHTADVIQYRECGTGSECRYRSIADYPFQRRGGPTGPAINPGFLGEDVQTPDNFAQLTDPTFAYTPYVPAAEATVKVPAWLNDVRWYHNRGNTTYTGESATLGDFSGLDDLDTENPRVVQGMIEIFGDWIDRYGVDGFRIDTARHVNPEFWARFVPAMLDRAKAKGIPNFHIFGEVAYETLDVGMLARHTMVDKLPAVLDFAFRQAVLEAVTGQQEPGAWDKLVLGDALYAHGFDTASILPTFVSNHDAGRLGFFIRKALPQASDDEQLKREMLANAMLLTWRGVPTIYAGDEQGFAGDGGDQDAREDMFASRVAVYNDNKLIGSDTTTATAHFGEDHPLFKQIAQLARLRLSHPALTRGRLVLRARDDKPGLVAVSRFDPASGAETLLAFNTSGETVTRQVQVEVGSSAFTTLAGSCAATASAPGSVTITLPAFGYAICEAHK
jgi:glycosidase